MAQTVEQLAETVGASVERLLSQMKEAGLTHSAAEEEVSEEDKQTLLAALKRSHGEGEAAPRKITLKRKQLSTLRTGGSGKRTVPGRAFEPSVAPRLGASTGEKR